MYTYLMSYIFLFQVPWVRYQVALRPTSNQAQPCIRMDTDQACSDIKTARIRAQLCICMDTDHACSEIKTARITARQEVTRKYYHRLFHIPFFSIIFRPALGLKKRCSIGVTPPTLISQRNEKYLGSEFSTKLNKLGCFC